MSGHDLCHLSWAVDTPTPGQESRDRGFLEGLSCIVPKRHFRITSYEEQYGDILYVFCWSRQDDIIL